jgi:hypothetical protein
LCTTIKVVALVQSYAYFSKQDLDHNIFSC